MRAVPLLVCLVAGPVVGALAVIALGGTRTWQVMLGAIVGQAASFVITRIWSRYAASRAIARALEAASKPRGTIAAGDPSALRPSNVMITATNIGLRDNVVTFGALAVFAALVGGLVSIGQHLFTLSR